MEPGERKTAAGEAVSVPTITLVSPDNVTARSMLPDPLQRYVRIDPATNLLAITAPPEFLQRILRDLATIDVPVGEDTVYIRLDHLPAGEALTVLPENLQRFVRVDAHANRLAVTAPPDSRELIRERRRSRWCPAWSWRHRRASARPEAHRGAFRLQGPW